ncbi:MAG: substrate-binding domain-containing protein [Velocimicrobium sp.]
MKKKVISILVVMSMIGTLLTGCGATSKDGTDSAVTSEDKTVAGNSETKETPTADKTFKVGFAQKTLENEFQTALANGLVEAGKKAGIEVTVLDAKNDIANEQTNMETFISQGYDLIFINVVDTQAATASIEAANEAGIPVIGIDSHVADDAPVVTNISAPDRENGRVVGLYAVTQYDSDEMISAAILSGNKGNPGGQDRRVGEFCGILEGRLGCSEDEAWTFAETFDQELTDNGKAVNEEAKFEVVAQGWGNWTTDEGLPAMEDILVANGTINCLLGENDSMLIGGAQAIEEVGKSDQIQIFAAADSMKEALQLIKDGTNYKASGLNNPELVAAKGIEVAVEILFEGKDPSSFDNKVTTDPVAVTIDNVDEYYDPDAIF